MADVLDTATEIMVDVGNPDLAFQNSFLPVAGLARMEFIIWESIRAHPMALLSPEAVSDVEARSAILEIGEHTSGEDYFVERLSEGVGTIAAAFCPRPVIVRMSDFKSNEYASPVGGEDFEPSEAKPMIGFGGASRYAHPAYEEGFALECAAMKRARNEMGLNNIKLMIPFCRRVEEGAPCPGGDGRERAAPGRERAGGVCDARDSQLRRAGGSAEIFDGFSIGSNDLTQLVLGVDRDSELVAFDFDE